MRNLKIFALLLAVSVAFTSYKNDDSRAALLGQWHINKEVTLNFENNKNVNEEIQLSDQNEHFIKINSNSTGFWETDGNAVPFTYSLDSQGKLFTMIISGVKAVYTVKTLSETNMVLYIEDTATHNGVAYKESTEYTLSKFKENYKSLSLN